jgi:hypothetical protein
MKFLVYCLFALNQILHLFKIRPIFTNSIEGRHRNPAFPEQGRFTNEDARTIRKAAMRWSRQLRRTMPKQKTFGGQQMVRGAVGAVAIYRALRDFGIEKPYAIKLGGDIGYQFYKSTSDPLRWVARLFARNPSKQMDLIQRLIIEIVLQSPDYEIVVRKPPSRVEVNVLRCPPYEYVKTFGTEEMEFFQKTNCTFDWPVAEYWVKGGCFSRTKTLSHGDEMCDQKWCTN